MTRCRLLYSYVLEKLTASIFRVQELLLDFLYSEYGGSKLLRNVGNYWQIDMASYTRRVKSKLIYIVNSCASTNGIYKIQFYVLKNLKKKLISNNVILVPADKGRTIVAVDNTVYENIEIYCNNIKSNLNYILPSPKHNSSP
jgi:hypothetical protein